MFELDKAVDIWLAEFQSAGIGSESQRDELKDHLYCLIEEFQAGGDDAETAFKRAARHLGHANELGSEFNKNRSLLAAIYACESRALEAGDQQRSKHMSKKMMIGHSIIWAAAMIGSAILLRGTEQAGSIQLLLIALWVGSVATTHNFAEAARAESAYFKKLWRKIKTS